MKIRNVYGTNIRNNNIFFFFMSFYLMKYFIPLSMILFSCASSLENPSADHVINQSIKAGGLDQLMGRRVSFDFRNQSYSLLRTPHEYIYSRTFEDSLGTIRDILRNSIQFDRYLNGVALPVSKEWSDKYASSVNSVLYFVQLPLTLKDPAVIKTYQKKANIHGKNYHQIEVRFTKENGGEDFEDIFLYWFDTKTFMMDFFAYSYKREGGGVRFREAINRRFVKGVVFQDYINYKPEIKTTPLHEMLPLYLKHQLIEVSRIENENIVIEPI